jgi:glycosyltransferase involved in cell wall biosynthesis
MLDWKRVDLLLEAVAVVAKDSNFGCLNLVGSGPEKPRLLDLARKLGLGEKCVFHEPVTADQVRMLMRQADVYVLPSNRCEGWGAVANEAMSEGAVLVANEQAGGPRTLVDHGRTGFLFQDNDAAGLARILRMLLRDSGLRETVRQVAWQEIQRLWHPRVGAERLLALCRGLLGLAPMPEFQAGPCMAVAGQRSKSSWEPSGSGLSLSHGKPLK